MDKEQQRAACLPNTKPNSHSSAPKPSMLPTRADLPNSTLPSWQVASLPATAAAADPLAAQHTYCNHITDHATVAQGFSNP
jgi:hypothetical protein